MGTRIEMAQQLHKSGFNCAQSVVAAFAESYGISREEALRFAGGFGGGVRCGEICGAVTGAVMVVGFVHGQTKPGDLESKAVCGEKTIEFLNAFKAKHSVLQCRELLGCDTSTQEGKAYFQQNNLQQTICMDLIFDAVRILEELGY